jgi:hypothetical protein
MINLNDYVEKVWQAETLEQKREMFKQLVEASHAKKQKKLQALREMLSMTEQQIDFCCVNFAMAGEGLKVIK